MDIDELQNDLMKRGLHPKACSFKAGVLTAAEQYCIAEDNGIWEVYYYERGNKNDRGLFLDEQAACEDLRVRLLADKTAWLKGAPHG